MAKPPSVCLSVCLCLPTSPQFPPSLKDGFAAKVLLGKHAMTDEQLQTLVDYGLARNGALPLECLDLRCNRLSGFAAPALKKLIAFTSTLQILNLSHNKLGDEGLLALGEALPRNLSVRYLDVRHNGSGELGLCAIAHAMQLRPSLSTVLVWGNHFGPAACVAFLETLERGEQEIVTDVEPYIVDGVTQVARVDVDE
uniref:Leucine-rich repeat-containing protein 34 n=1 Tax=Tetraselmis sp. GSL018 TaxID=582737 RepID=A0A061S5X5_9CHLO